MQIDCNRERRDRPQVSKPRLIVQIREVTTKTFNCKLVKMIQKMIEMKHKTYNGYLPLPVLIWETRGLLFIKGRFPIVQIQIQYPKHATVFRDSRFAFSQGRL